LFAGEDDLEDDIGDIDSKIAASLPAESRTVRERHRPGRRLGGVGAL
jgi:hypothetical protein